ncbi:hypothetical protein BvCms2454_04955 [Escherichia coli]|nr:hypothetical protein BvCms2454_04955 [Escherichia coli]
MPATIRQLPDKRATEKIFPHPQPVTGTPSRCVQFDGGKVATVNADPGIHFSGRAGTQHPDAPPDQFQGDPLHLVITGYGIAGNLSGSLRNGFLCHTIYCPGAGLWHHTGIKDVQITDGVFKTFHNIAPY